MAVDSLGKNDIQQLQMQLATVLAFNPYQIQAREAQARVDQWSLSSRTDSEKMVSGEKVLGSYRALIESRPSWPYHWLNLALTKAQLQQFDQEFAHAYLRVQKLAPWAKDIQVELVLLGLQAWYKLDEVMQQQVLDVIDRAAVSNKVKIIALIRQQQMQNEVCAAISSGTLSDVLCI